MSALNRIASLRELLDRPPSKALWEQVIAYASQWEGSEDFSIDLAYIETHLQDWPDNWRKVPEQHRIEWLQPNPPSYFRLFRSLTFVDEDLSHNKRRKAERGIDRLLFNPALSSLTSLHLLRCHLQPDEILAIANCKALSRLHTLSLCHQWFESRNLQALLTSPHMQQLRKLDVSHSFLKDRYALILAQTGHPSIETLIADDTGIDIRGAQAIFGSLMWPSLRQLSMRDNRFGQAMTEHGRPMHAFQDPFASPPELTLHSLDISNNGLHPSQGDALIERGFLSTLTNLEIERNSLAPGFVKALVARHQKQPFDSLNVRHLPQIDLADAQLLLATGHDMRSLRFPWPLPGVERAIEDFTVAEWPEIPSLRERPIEIPDVTFAGRTMRGPAHETNQDAWGYNVQDGLFVLADGDGENDAGATFAQCLVGGLVAWAQATGVKGEHWQLDPSHHVDEWRPWRMDLEQVPSQEPFAHPMQWLLYRIVHLAQLLTDLQGEAIEYVGAQSSLLALQCWQHHIGIVHVGFDQLFRIRDGEICRITDSLSLPDQIERGGLLPDNTYMMSLNERSFRPALGNPMTTVATVQIEESCFGDIFAMCTDGITETLSPAQILASIQETQHLGEACRAVLEQVSEADGQDNATIVLVRLNPPDHNIALASEAD